MNFYPEFNIAREIYTNKSLFKYVTSVVLYKYTGINTLEQGGHGTGNLVLTFSRQGKHGEFCSDTGKNLLTQGKYLDCDY